MDKKIIFFILSVSFIFICGCETLKGAFEGAKKDWQVLIEADRRIQQTFW